MASDELITSIMEMWSHTYRVDVTDQAPFYRNSLGTVTDDELRHAALWINSHDEWMPKIARIHEVIRMQRRERESRAPALPPGQERARPEQQRLNQYGHTMTSAALAGYGTRWRSSSGDITEITPPDNDKPWVLFDWANDTITMQEAT